MCQRQAGLVDMPARAGDLGTDAVFVEVQHIVHGTAIGQRGAARPRRSEFDREAFRMRLQVIGQCHGDGQKTAHLRRAAAELQRPVASVSIARTPRSRA